MFWCSLCKEISLYVVYYKVSIYTDLVVLVRHHHTNKIIYIFSQEFDQMTDCESDGMSALLRTLIWSLSENNTGHAWFTRFSIVNPDHSIIIYWALLVLRMFLSFMKIFKTTMEWASFLFWKEKTVYSFYSSMNRIFMHIKLVYFHSLYYWITKDDRIFLHLSHN